MITYILVFCFNYMIDEKRNVKVDTGFPFRLRASYQTCLAFSDKSCRRVVLETIISSIKTRPDLC